MWLLMWLGGYWFKFDVVFSDTHIFYKLLHEKLRIVNMILILLLYIYW